MSMDGTCIALKENFGEWVSQTNKYVYRHLEDIEYTILVTKSLKSVIIWFHARLLIVLIVENYRIQHDVREM